MAVVSKVATLELTLSSGTRKWTATATIQDTAAGGSVSVALVQNKTGVTPPALPDTITLDFQIDNSTTSVKSFAITPSDSDGATSTSTFFFTSTGASGGANRAGTIRIRIRAENHTAVAALNYDVNTDNNPADSFGTGSTASVTIRNQGWIRGTTTSTSALSNVALGGAKSSPASYDDSLFVRTTLGAALYSARALTVTISGASPTLSGATSSATSGNFDATFTGVTDNRFPISSQTVATALTIPNPTLATLNPDFTVTETTDSMTVDPRLTIVPQAQKATPRTNGGNITLYVISADQLFIWANVKNARAENVSGVTMTQRIKNGAAVIQTDSTQTTGADGWTAASPGVDMTNSVVAPAGNRTQEALPSAPADAVGLGTGSQVLGFASAYTADKALAIHVTDESSPGVAQTIKVEYLRSDGTRPALDAAPTIRVYSLNAAGTQVDALAATTATRIGASESWQTTWTPGLAGIYIVEARGAFAGGGLDAAETVKVIPRTVFDPTGLFA